MAEETVNGVKLLVLDANGVLLSSEADALDVIGQTYGLDVDAVIVPASRFAPAFFQLSTTLAGLFIQKFQNYRLRLIVLGDIARAVSESQALADFVRETNRTGHHLFVTDRAELADRLRDTR
ncbi:DUF4180 domain-containing protein [Devosia sp. SD17-2]|uniref:DUF4180 domain-containing protein n=1 Tax=Devosia sp. SD17-2 TaxID=2976459 RepID=UPI0023D8255F|nr:DUF4180 domain-containing protein [Devosia sp. SD17-2]WEJ32498.1 DUF4180 domain-containing protein [Devosia sp. SD17-2]